MIKNILAFFKLSPIQEQILKLVRLALENKTYTIDENRFANYDDETWHTFTVIIKLSSNTTIKVHSASKVFKVLNKESNEYVWSEEISSTRAYKEITSHFLNLLLQKEKDLIFEKNQIKDRAMNGVNLDMKTENVKSIMRKNFE